MARPRTTMGQCAANHPLSSTPVVVQKELRSDEAQRNSANLFRHPGYGAMSSEDSRARHVGRRRGRRYPRSLLVACSTPGPKLAWKRYSIQTPQFAVDVVVLSLLPVGGCSDLGGSSHRRTRLSSTTGWRVSGISARHIPGEADTPVHLYETTGHLDDLSGEVRLASAAKCPNRPGPWSKR